MDGVAVLVPSPKYGGNYEKRDGVNLSSPSDRRAKVVPEVGWTVRRRDRPVQELYSGETAKLYAAGPGQNLSSDQWTYMFGAVSVRGYSESCSELGSESCIN
jgi:hypothetical protein